MNHKKTRKTIFKSEKASAAIEMAILTPVIILLLFPMIDAGRFMLLKFKLDRMTHEVGKLVSETISCNIAKNNNYLSDRDNDNFLRVTNYVDATHQILSPWSVNDNSVIGEISSYTGNGSNNPTLNWGRKDISPSLSNQNQLVAQVIASEPNFGKVSPALLPLASNQNVITVHYFVKFEPLFDWEDTGFIKLPFLKQSYIYSETYFKPTYDDLIYFPPLNTKILPSKCRKN